MLVIKNTLIIFSSALISLFINISYAATATFTIAGQHEGNPSSPLLAVSHDNGQRFESKKLTNVPKNTHLNKVKCFSHGSTALCIAIGDNIIPGASFDYVIAVSNDNGNHWTAKQINEVKDGIFSDVSCLQGICMLVGYRYGDNTTYPLFAISHDNGNTWSTQKIPQTPKQGLLNSISCIENGTSPFCVVAGNDVNETEPTKPFVMLSHNLGKTWINQSHLIPGFGPDDIISQIHMNCFGGSLYTPVCILSGTNWGDIDKTGGASFMAVSIDGAQTWLKQKVDHQIDGVHCSGSGPTALCSTIGTTVGETMIPKLLVSKNGGQTWQEKIPSFRGLLSDISCLGKGATACCIAIGEDDHKHQPFMIQSNDAGENWTTINYLGNLSRAHLNRITCKEQNQLCLVAGYEYDAITDMTKPFLNISNDGGKTWSSQNLVASIMDKGKIFDININ